MRTTLNGPVNTSAILTLSCIATATLAALLETSTSAGEDLNAAINEPVSFGFTGNYEVDRTANNAIPMGHIVALERRSATDYLLTVAVDRLTPSGTNAKPFRPIAVVQLPYRSGATVTLGKPVIVDATSAIANYDDSGADADGLGCILAKDTTGLTIDVAV